MPDALHPAAPGEDVQRDDADDAGHQIAGGGEGQAEAAPAGKAQGLVGAADVVCEAFDNAQAKAMLVDTVLGSFNNKFLVAASGMAGYNSANDIKTRKVGKRFYLCGDAVSEVNDAIGLIAPRVALCAAHQALMAIRLLCGMEE